MKRIAVIGAGAAGMTAAFFALESGALVTVFEKNKQAGRKICITGKGRCNLTNAIHSRDFLSNVVSGSKFLSSAIYRFSPDDTMEWFRSLGVPLKVERGNRVFPESDRASDVRDALWKAVSKHPHTTVCYGAVTKVVKGEGGFSVFTHKENAGFDSVIVATGGASYPLTGSSGDGYRIARDFSHEITPISPSLVRVICSDKCCKQAQGLTLKNVRLTLLSSDANKPLFSEQGELLFTEDGISGPLALSASAHLRSAAEYRFEIDFKPALSDAELDARLLRDFAENTNRQFKHVFDSLLPASMRPIFVECSGLDPVMRVHQITRSQRERLVHLFKHFPLNVRSLGPLEEAIVTAGGVSLKEVDPHTMQSRLCKGLYFAGEVLDVDAYTGGFNLQIAFSTGKLSGESAALCDE